MGENPVDIWRAAKRLIEEYGDNAVLEAWHRAHIFLRERDRQGEAIWLAVLFAVEQWQRTKPRAGERVN